MRKNNRKNSGWKDVFNQPWFLGINLVILGFVGWSYLREVSHGNDIAGQLSDLKRQADETDAKNRDFETLLNKVGTKSFVEREARLTLGYQKPGEQEIYLTNGQSPDASSSAVSGQNNSDLSNPQKWWNYFFGAP